MNNELALWLPLAAAVVAVLYGLWTARWVVSQPAGNDKMQEIARAIQEGASAYMNRQYGTIGIVGVVPGFERELPGSPPVREMGCIGYIASHEELPDGRFLLWLLGLERFRILEELKAATAYRQVRVKYEPTHESPKRLAEIRELRKEMRDLLPSLVELDAPALGQFADHVADVSDAQLIALACQILELRSDRKQEVLEAGSLSERFLMLYEDLYKHLDVHPGVEDLDPDSLN